LGYGWVGRSPQLDHSPLNAHLVGLHVRDVLSPRQSAQSELSGSRTYLSSVLTKPLARPQSDASAVWSSAASSGVLPSRDWSSVSSCLAGVHEPACRSSSFVSR
jgi:hypothetical protein